jgi:hypothetical protein
MATKTIRQIDNELTVSGITLADVYIETENSLGSYKASLLTISDKFASEVTGVTYDSGLSPTLEVPDSVGGIVAGTHVADLTGKTFSELFDDLLFPTVDPVLVAPYNTFTDDATDIQEIGTVIGSILFSIGLNRGSITLDSVFQDYRSGLAVNPNGYNYTGSGLTLLTSSATQTLTSYTVLQGTQSWTGSVNYAIGPQPLNNKGGNYSTPLAPGTTTPQTTSIEGVYPLWATTISITGVSSQTLISMNTNPAPNSTPGGGLLLVPESGGNKQTFDVPTAWTNFDVKGIRNWDTNTNQWVYQGSSTQAHSLDFWTTSSVVHGSVNYKRFVYNGLDRGPMSIYLEF